MRGDLVEAERIPRKATADKEGEAWFYVSRGEIFVALHNGHGYSNMIKIPTRSMRRALASMDRQVAARKGARKAKR